MKKKEIIAVLESAGMITLDRLFAAAYYLNMDTEASDLDLLGQLVEDGLVERFMSRGATLYGLPRPERSQKEIHSVLVDEFDEEEFTVSKASKALGMKPAELEGHLASMEKQGMIKHVGDGKYMGKKFPKFKAVIR